MNQEIEQQQERWWGQGADRRSYDLMSASTFTDKDLPSDEEIHDMRMTDAFGKNWKQMVATQHLRQ